MSSYNIFPEIDQIQEEKTTKSTIRNKSKNSSFIPSLSHLQKPYDNHYETKVWSTLTLNKYALSAIFRSFSLLFDHRAAWLNSNLARTLHLSPGCVAAFCAMKKMCMMCMVLSPNCCAVTIFEYSTTEDTLPSCLSVPSEHVASQSKWQSADLDLVKLAKKRKSVWPALFRGNVCI